MRKYPPESMFYVYVSGSQDDITRGRPVGFIATGSHPLLQSDALRPQALVLVLCPYDFPTLFAWLMAIKRRPTENPKLAIAAEAEFRRVHGAYRFTPYTFSQYTTSDDLAQLKDYLESIPAYYLPDVKAAICVYGFDTVAVEVFRALKRFNARRFSTKTLNWLKAWEARDNADRGNRQVQSRSRSRSQSMSRRGSLSDAAPTPTATPTPVTTPSDTPMPLSKRDAAPAPRPTTSVWDRLMSLSKPHASGTAKRRGSRAQGQRAAAPVAQPSAPVARPAAAFSDAAAVEDARDTAGSRCPDSDAVSVYSYASSVSAGGTYRFRSHLRMARPTHTVDGRLTPSAQAAAEDKLHAVPIVRMGLFQLTPTGLRDPLANVDDNGNSAVQTPMFSNPYSRGSKGKRGSPGVPGTAVLDDEFAAEAEAMGVARGGSGRRQAKRRHMSRPGDPAAAASTSDLDVVEVALPSRVLEPCVVAMANTNLLRRMLAALRGDVPDGSSAAAELSRAHAQLDVALEHRNAFRNVLQRMAGESGVRLPTHLQPQAGGRQTSSDDAVKTK